MNQECRPTNKTGDRNVLCPYYNDCLNYVISRAWKDWDCTSCSNKLTQETITDFPLTSADVLPHYELPFEIYQR